MKQATPEYVKTLPEVAERLSMSEKTLCAWRREGLVFPVKGVHGYNFGEFKRRLSDFVERRKAGVDKNKLTDPRERKLNLECERLVINIKIDDERLKQSEIETKRLQSGVIPMADHRQTMDDIRTLYLDGLNQIVENVATKLRSVKARDALQGAVDGLRNRIAKTGE